MRKQYPPKGLEAWLGEVREEPFFGVNRKRRAKRLAKTKKKLSLFERLIRRLRG